MTVPAHVADLHAGQMPRVVGAVADRHSLHVALRHERWLRRTYAAVAMLVLAASLAAAVLVLVAVAR